MDVTRRESLDRCLSGQLLFTCHSLKGTLCAGSSGFPFLVSCTCQSFLFAANMSMICCRNFRRKKIARSSVVSREAKVVQRYGDFLTRQNFCQNFNKVLQLAGCPALPRRGRFPFAGAKVRRLFRTHQIFRLFFSRKNHFFQFLPSTPINIIRVMEKQTVLRTGGG